MKFFTKTIKSKIAALLAGCMAFCVPFTSSTMADDGTEANVTFILHDVNCTYTGETVSPSAIEPGSLYWSEGAENCYIDIQDDMYPGDDLHGNYWVDIDGNGKAITTSEENCYLPSKPGTYSMSVAYDDIYTGHISEESVTDAKLTIAPAEVEVTLDIVGKPNGSIVDAGDYVINASVNPVDTEHFDNDDLKGTLEVKAAYVKPGSLLANSTYRKVATFTNGSLDNGVKQYHVKAINNAKLYLSAIYTYSDENDTERRVYFETNSASNIYTVNVPEGYVPTEEDEDNDDESTETTTGSSSDESTETTTGTSSDESTETTTRSSSDESTETTTRSSSDESTETTTRSSSDESTETTTRSSSDESSETTTRSSSDNSSEATTAKIIVRPDRTTETTTSDNSTETTTNNGSDTPGGDNSTETTTNNGSDTPGSDNSTETTTNNGSDTPGSDNSTETTTNSGGNTPGSDNSTETTTNNSGSDTPGSDDNTETTTNNGSDTPGSDSSTETTTNNGGNTPGSNSSTETTTNNGSDTPGSDDNTETTTNSASDESTETTSTNVDDSTETTTNSQDDIASGGGIDVTTDSTTSSDDNTEATTSNDDVTTESTTDNSNTETESSTGSDDSTESTTSSGSESSTASETSTETTTSGSGKSSNRGSAGSGGSSSRASSYGNGKSSLKASVISEGITAGKGGKLVVDSNNGYYYVDDNEYKVPTPTPDKGYEFDHWEINETETKDSIKGEKFSKNTKIKAVFKKVGSGSSKKDDFKTKMEDFYGITFYNEGSLTRGELVGALAFSLNNGNIPKGSSNFTDVNSNDWYYDSVCYYTAQGVLNGYGDGTFRPGKAITKAELAVIICKLENINVSTATNGVHWASAYAQAVSNYFYVNSNDVTDLNATVSKDLFNSVLNKIAPKTVETTTEETTEATTETTTEGVTEETTEETTETTTKASKKSAKKSSSSSKSSKKTTETASEETTESTTKAAAIDNAGDEEYTDLISSLLMND